MGYVGNTPAEKYASFAVQNFTVTATTNYTLDHPVANENDIRLVINNVVQHPGSGKAYTASGTTLTLSEATAGTDTMYCVFLGKAVQTVTPSNSSVTNAMLVADAVNGDKIADDSISDEHLDITAITGQTEKTSLADADKFLISDSAASGALKYVQKSNLPSGTHVKLLGGTASSAVNQDFTGYVDTSNYSQYLVTLNNVVGLQSNSFTFAFITSGGSVTSAYYNWVVNGWRSNGSAQTYQGEGQTTGKLGTPLAGAGTASGTYHFWLSHNPNGTGYGNSLFGANWGYRSDYQDYIYTNFAIGYSEAITTTGFRIYADGNDATTFDYAIYGIAK